MPLTTVSSLLLFRFGINCRLLSLCPLPSRPSSLDWWASRQFRCQFRHSSCFHLTLQHVFICLWNLDLSFASCTSCTSAMHDITQLWGMCIIGKEEEGLTNQHIMETTFPANLLLMENTSQLITWLMLNKLNSTMIKNIQQKKVTHKLMLMKLRPGLGQLLCLSAKNRLGPFYKDYGYEWTDGCGFSCHTSQIQLLTF